MKTTSLALAAMLLAAPAFAEVDVANGEKLFNQCQTCHVVADAEGKVLAGKNAKVGPNLYGIVGRTAGTYEGFKYGKDIVAAGAAGLVWTPELLTAYVQDPADFLRTTLNDRKAKSGMSFKVKKAEDAADLAAFLATFGPTATN